MEIAANNHRASYCSTETKKNGSTAIRERALIAEDNDDMRNLIQEVLEDAGYEILASASGRQALAYVEKESEVIDLVITDVRMTEMTGDDRSFEDRYIPGEGQEVWPAIHCRQSLSPSAGKPLQEEGGEV
jgi:Response regulator receiver domain